jgi:hypothetical protein
MGIIEYFRDWMANNEEREKFHKSWIIGKIGNFKWPDEQDKYHADIAYEIFKLTQRIEELEKQIK